MQSITFVTNLATNAGLTYSFACNRGSTPNTVVTDPDGVAATYYYDALGRVTKVSDSAGNSQQFAWTSDNHVQTHTDAYNHTTNYGYDGNNNLTSITLPPAQLANGAQVQWQYTDTGHPFSPTKFTDAQGNQVTYTYDTAGNLHTIADQLASQNSATVNHNANGTVSSVVDFNGNTTSYTYDTKGNLTKITPPTIQAGQGTQLGATNITPDTLSRPGTVQDGKGQNTVYTYDALDRTHVATYADSSTITNNFDADGNLTSLVDNTGTTSFVYDLLNRQLAKTLPGQSGTACTVTIGGVTASGTLCYTYDGASDLTSYLDAGAAITCNGLTVTVCYGYNTLNELTSLVDPSNRTTTFGYDNNHNRTTTTYPGNTVQTATYDNAQRLTAISAVNGATTLTNFTSSYTSPVTNTDTLLVYSSTRSDSTNHSGTVANTYDKLNCLVEWQFTKGTGSVLNSHDYRYSYDGNGNRTHIVPDTTTAETFLSYNATNEWYQSTDHLGHVNTISWDAAGNMTGNNGFNGLSQPLVVTYNAKEQTATQTDNTQPTNLTWTRTFTGRGQFEQTQETSNATPPVTHSYTYSRLGLTKITGSTATYVRDPWGTLVSQQGVTGGPYYYLSDGLGSVAGMADTSGGQAAGYLYCPTGNPAEPAWGSNPSVNPFQFGGVFYEPGFQSYWIGDYQFDSNSGNAFQSTMGPDVIQAGLYFRACDPGGTGVCGEPGGAGSMPPGPTRPMPPAPVEPSVTLYRAVGPSELADIQSFGDYNTSPSFAGKYFALLRQGAVDFASSSFNAGRSMTITSVELPQSFVNSRGFFFNDPGGAGSSVYFAEEDLPDLYNAMGAIQILGPP